MFFLASGALLTSIKALFLSKQKLGSLKDILAIQNARNAKKAQGSVLEFGFTHHVNNMKSALEKGLPADPRFPERDHEWIEKRTKENQLLVEWLEGFKSQFCGCDKAAETIGEAEAVLKMYEDVVNKVKVQISSSRFNLARNCVLSATPANI